MSARTTILQSSSDPWSLRLATDLRQRGEEVVVVLLDSGAELARRPHPASSLVSAAIDAGAGVMVDADALRRRGIPLGSILEGIKPTDIAATGDLLVDSTDKVVWL